MSEAPSRDEIVARLGDDLPVGIWVARVPCGELIYANARFAAIMGMAAREDVAVGAYAEPYQIRNRAGAPYPEDGMPFVRAMRERATVVVEDLVIHRADGRKVNIRAHAQPGHDAAGVMTHVVIAFFDITAQVEAEAGRLESERRLARAQRLESIGVLAGGIAHDFNNLLAAVQILASSLQREALAPAQQAAVSQIEEVAQSAANLTRNLLGFAGRGRTLGSRVQLDDVVGMVGALSARTFDRRISVVQELGAPGAWVVGDFAQLEQVVMNLAVNARDAMGEGGGRLVMATRVEDGDAVLEVTDTGSGIPAEIRDRIFEPYFTTKTTGETLGSGLGLATVYGIVHSHGGSIEIEDALPRGTKFRVRLPRLVDASLQVAPRREVATVVHGGGTVMLVDDEPHVRTACAEALRAIGYEVLTAADGVEALAIFRERGNRVDAVILDLVMPRMDGRATYLALRDLDPKVKVLVATATGSAGDFQRLLELGVVETISKPFDLPALSAALARVRLGTS